jgi:hypothetical protein
MDVTIEYLRHQFRAVVPYSLWFKRVDNDNPFVYVISPEFQAKLLIRSS